MATHVIPITHLIYDGVSQVFYTSHKQLKLLQIDSVDKDDEIVIVGFTKSVSFYFSSSSDALYFRPIKPLNHFLLMIKDT